LGNQVVSFLLRVGSRLQLVKRESWESIQASDLRRLRKLLAQYRASPLSEDVEQTIYDTLFRTIGQKSEQSSGYFRRLTRDEIYAALQIVRSEPTQSVLVIPSYIEYLASKASRLGEIISLERSSLVL
jgi:hypothetical protein